MVEQGAYDVTLPIAALGNQVHFSSDNDPRWAGMVALQPFAALTLSQQARNDLYIVSGGLSDANRTYPASTFISSGTQRAAARLHAGAGGALLFVYSDQLQTTSAFDVLELHELDWFQGGAEGMQVARLSSFNHPLSLVLWQPGTRLPFHRHPHGEEIFVLAGQLQDQGGKYPAGTWLRFHADAGHAPFSECETLILLRNGHLRA